MILIPAYNLNAKLATKYEAQIAAAIHRHRAEELEALKIDHGPRTLTANPQRRQAPRDIDDAAPCTPSARLGRPWAGREGIQAPTQPNAGDGPQRGAEGGAGMGADPGPDLIIKAAYARYQPGGTNPTDELIMKILTAYPTGLAIVDIAHKLSISRQATKGALDRLTRKALVKPIPVKEIPYSQRQSYGASLKAVWVVRKDGAR
jgi:hypothetical protein